MEYRKIVAVTGLPGLFEILSSKSDGAIVRSLEENITKFISSRVHHLSHLESIEIYTTGDNVNLSKVFQAMKESTEALPGAKDNKQLKAYFEKVYPELDFERVYTSDMKKMVKWFELLQKNNIDFILPEESVEDEEAQDKVLEEAHTPVEVAEVAEASAEKAKSKSGQKKAIAEPATTDEAPATEAKPKVKRAKKAKSEGEKEG